MKKTFLILCLTVFSLMICRAQRAEVLTTDAFQQKLSETPEKQVLDVRTKEEFSGDRLPDALNADFTKTEEFTERVRFLDKNKPVFVYCLSGGRSQKAAEYLTKQGFREVYDMKGGMRSWLVDQKPVAAGSSRNKKPGMTEAAFHQEVERHAPRLVLADFGARWCPPCKKMAPEMERLSKELTGTLVVLPVDVDEHQTLSQVKKVNVLPTLILYKNGKVVWQHEGYASREEIMAQVKKFQ
jgi:thioredoxin